MPSLRDTGKIGQNAAGLRALAAQRNLPFPLSLRLLIAAQEIAQFHTDSLAILSVGSPTEPTRRMDGGGFTQPHTFGSIIKPQDEAPPQLGDRVYVSIEIAAIRCFASDDPGGTDEPYVISTVYALDPSRPEDLVQTRRIDHSDLGDASAGTVFAHGRQLAANVTVPGDGEIRIHLQLWDEELVGSTSKLKEATSTAAQAAIAAAATYFGGPAGAAGSIVTAATGLLATVGDAIGKAVGDIVEDLVGDDLIDQHDYVIPSSFLRALTSAEDPAVLNRTSPSIEGVTYNFPDTVEDDSWLLERGSGTYRVFFRINRLAKT